MGAIAMTETTRARRGDVMVWEYYLLAVTFWDRFFDLTAVGR